MLADVRFLSGVQDHVLLQVPLQAVGLLAVRTGEGTLPAVIHLEITPLSFEIAPIIVLPLFLFTGMSKLLPCMMTKLVANKGEKEKLSVHSV